MIRTNPFLVRFQNREETSFASFAPKLAIELREHQIAITVILGAENENSRLSKNFDLSFQVFQDHFRALRRIFLDDNTRRIFLDDNTLWSVRILWLKF